VEGSSCDVTGYDKAMDEGWPRQLARAKFGLTPDAFDQLRDHTFIFHWLYAWQCLKWNVVALLTYRCQACGGHHWRNKERERFFCGYGYSWTLRHAWTSWWWAGKHGDD
jgi:hypothetical protein